MYSAYIPHTFRIHFTQIQLHEYEGEYSYLGTTLRQANIEPQPSLSDVRRLITQFAILPIGLYCELFSMYYVRLITQFAILSIGFIMNCIFYII